MAFGKLLVANRGEVAARVFRTCDRLGIATVAVAAPDDRGALHVRRAREVREVGSYLDARELVGAALAAGADAVHPGWGFLAESPAFAAAVQEAGLAWVGPPAAAMRLAGDKLEAKRVALAAGIPTLPSGDASEVGFPLIVKAAAGGGGRGMRIVRRPEELEAALAAAGREAAAAFGDGRVYCEPLVERAAHVEVQLLADRAGGVIHLGERDCSVQRRHQKVLEETPSPVLDARLRDELCAAAVAFARAVGYENAGTVEFLVSAGRFWLSELNARLQVEHPVTELVTGLDLVEEQLRLAAGEPVPPPPVRSGHAVEARLYAEHPLTFLPQSGTVERLVLPRDVRVDAGIEEGDTIPIAYDPLLAKIVAAGPTRAEALARLGAALAATRIGGATTNLAFLRWLVAHPEVRAGAVTTAFLADHPPLSRPRRPAKPWAGWFRLNRDPAEPPPPPAPPPFLEAAAHPARLLEERSELAAPVPGTVLRVLAAPGEKVEARQPLIVLEAMKMETPLVSPYEAVVRRILVAEGDQVTGGTVLVELED